jgi:hypothetical protein
LRKISSAAFCPSLPADTKALPKPGNAMETGFFSAVSVADMIIYKDSESASSRNDYQV